MGKQKITKNLFPDYKGDSVYTVKENGVKKGEIKKNLFPDWKGDSVYTFNEESDSSDRNSGYSSPSDCPGSSNPEPLGIGGTTFAMFIFGVGGAVVGLFVGGAVGAFLEQSAKGNQVLMDKIFFDCAGIGYFVGAAIGAVTGLIFGISSGKKNNNHA